MHTLDTDKNVAPPLIPVSPVRCAHKAPVYTQRCDLVLLLSVTLR